MMSRLKTDYTTLMRDIHSIYRHHDIPVLSERSESKGPNSSRRALAKKLGVELPPMGAELTTIKVHSLHAAGLSILQIAKQLNRCEAVIRRHLKRLPASPTSPSPAAAGEGRVRVWSPLPPGEG
jgi:hypothetical protein